jgi:hypothetical protein
MDETRTRDAKNPFGESARTVKDLQRAAKDADFASKRGA